MRFNLGLGIVFLSSLVLISALAFAQETPAVEEAPVVEAALEPAPVETEEVAVDPAPVESVVEEAVVEPVTESAPQAVAETSVETPQILLPPIQTSTPQAETTPSVDKFIPRHVSEEPEQPIRMRVEETYDFSGDRKLQSNEFKALLENVLGGLKSSTTYPVNCDVLVKFDKNGDGLIDRSEASAIESYIR